MPKGIIGAMLVLLVTAALVLLFGPGGAGAAAISDSDNPLPLAIREAYGGETWAADFVNYIGLAGLVASFFSIIYGYSRQLFALSRAGYLPEMLGRIHPRLGNLALRWAQCAAERFNGCKRRDLLRVDEQLQGALAFSGQLE